jgi:hypothetical protein
MLYALSSAQLQLPTANTTATAIASVLGRSARLGGLVFNLTESVQPYLHHRTNHHVSQQA